MGEKSVWRSIIGQVAGFVFFLILLLVANYLVKGSESETLKNIVGFFNANLLFLFGMMIVFLIADIFWVLMFPFNLPAPIASGFGAVMIVNFLWRLLSLIEGEMNMNILERIGFVPEVLYAVVFLLVLIFGYITILFRAMRRKRTEKKEEDEERKEPKKEESRRKERIEWEDVGEEFKGALYELGKKIRQGLSEEDSKNKKKKR